MDKENINYEKLYNMIVKDIPISNDNFVYAITFIGLPGMGKSTIANILSKKLNIYIAVNDEIRRILDKLGIDSSQNKQLTKKLIIDRIKFMLKNNTSMIIDGNAQSKYNDLERILNDFNAHCFFIKLECSEEEILKRLDYRESQFGKDKNNFSIATRKDYYSEKQLKSNQFPKEKIFFTINTEENIDSQIDMLVDKIKVFINNKL